MSEQGQSSTATPAPSRTSRAVDTVMKVGMGTLSTSVVYGTAKWIFAWVAAGHFVPPPDEVLSEWAAILAPIGVGLYNKFLSKVEN